MAEISLCMIVKNEEDVLARCLESVEGLVDEIIIVDTGSTDRTREIARRFTDRVYDFVWTENFAEARNYAFSLAEKPYCMWLDADDVILEADREVFKKLKEGLESDVCVVMAKYNVGFDEKGNVTFSYYRERIIKNNIGLRWEGAVHEAITPAGRVIHSEFAVTHRKTQPSDPDRNLRIYEKQLERGEELEPRAQFYYGRELYYHERYPEAVRVFEKFLDEDRGWIENNIDACCHCAWCYEKMSEPEKAFQSLLRSFRYDRPRAELCCELGRWFFERENMSLAAYWYSLALTCKRDDSRGGFVLPDCYGYLPCIQLCVCYSRLGDMERAEQMNELAAFFKPDSAAVAYNREFFSSLKKES